MPASTARLAAAAIALVALAGLGVQLSATFGITGSILATLAIVLRYFTVITNLAVAVLMGVIACGRRPGAFWLGGATLAILLVGVVYNTLLVGLVELSGGALLADAIMHKVVPLLVLIYWLLLGPRRGLRWRDPWWWSLYPLAYFLYALARAARDGIYPYPFMDVGQLGAARVLVNALAIAAAFVVAGEAMVALDRRAPLGPRARNR